MIPTNGGNTPPELEDKRWVYKDGVWTDGFETVIGPGTEGAEMSDEEMSEAWETGDYTWGEADGDEVVTPDVPGTPTPDTESETEVVWSAVLGGFVDPSVINPETGKPVGETPTPETPATEGEGDPNSITPSFACESGYIDGAGACVPVNDPRLPGSNPNPNADPNTDPNVPGEGEACTLGDGSAGTIQAAFASPMKALVMEGTAMVMAMEMVTAMVMAMATAMAMALVLAVGCLLGVTMVLQQAGVHCRHLLR